MQLFLCLLRVLNLVTNGDFATDTDWTKGTGWTISVEVLLQVMVLNGMLSNLYHDSNFFIQIDQFI